MNVWRKFAGAKRRCLYSLEVNSNAFFDRVLGMRTEYIQVPGSATIEDAVLSRAQRYHAANFHAISRSLWYVRRSFGGDTLVDLGCGAGRVLIVASIFGFRNLTGVEIDETLIKNAHDNVRRFVRRYPISCNPAIVHQSASDHQLNDVSSVVFMFNPFDDWIFDRFLQLNREAVQAGKLTFVCVNPRLGNMIEQSGYSVVKEWRNEDFSRIVRVYRHTAVAGTESSSTDRSQDGASLWKR